MNEDLLTRLCKDIGIILNTNQLNCFSQYFRELLEWNQKFNLTAIKDEEGVIVKHFYDSLLGTRYSGWNGTGQLLDMGTGAGFPGIPLKIVNPELQVVLVDSLQKRVGFLEHLINVLGLKGISAVHSRAEDLGQDQKHREKYSYVVSRAVAKMPLLCEFCLPLVKNKGVFMAYKGPEGMEELKIAETALKILGGKEKEILKFQLPLGGGERIITVLEKAKNTPQEYPRKAGIPAKKPL